MVVSTGSSAIDKILHGGIDEDCITTIYGPAGSGKTNLVLLAAVNVASKGKKAIYIDTEGGFSVERLKQLTEDHEKVMQNILFLKPTNFKEQVHVFSKLPNAINEQDVLWL